MRQVIFLSSLILVLIYSTVCSQTKSFLDEAQKMKISLCFKDFVLLDSHPGNIGTSDSIGIRKIFVRNDSTMMVAVNLNAGSQRAENMWQVS